MPKSEPITPEEQLRRWVAGESVHNSTRDECCPDFSCCRPDIVTPIEERKAFLRADEATRFSMLGEFLNRAIDTHRPNVAMHKPNRRARQSLPEPPGGDRTANDLKARLAVEMMAQEHFRIADAIRDAALFYDPHEGTLMLVHHTKHHALHINDLLRIETCLAGLVDNPKFEVSIVNNTTLAATTLFKDGQFYQPEPNPHD